jgi:hypothetical protein
MAIFSFFVTYDNSVKNATKIGIASKNLHVDDKSVAPVNDIQTGDIFVRSFGL